MSNRNFKNDNQYKLSRISISKIIKHKSLMVYSVRVINDSGERSLLHNMSIDTWKLIDNVDDISNLEDNLRAVSSKNYISNLFRRSRNILSDGFTNVVIYDNSVQGGPNIFKYNVFQYVLGINRGN